MEAQDIKDVLTVRDIIANADGTADLIATLIDWRDGSLGTVEVVPQQDHSAAEDAAAAVEAKAPPAPAKAAPAKAAPTKAASKGRAKPPPPPADDDDNEPSPDPSDDADF